jgi:hypothetical protein
MKAFLRSHVEFVAAGPMRRTGSGTVLYVVPIITASGTAEEVYDVETDAPIPEGTPRRRIYLGEGEITAVGEHVPETEFVRKDEEPADAPVTEPA